MFDPVRPLLFIDLIPFHHTSDLAVLICVDKTEAGPSFRIIEEAHRPMITQGPCLEIFFFNNIFLLRYMPSDFQNKMYFPMLAISA